MKRMHTLSLLSASLVLLYILVNLCSCDQVNLYLPPKDHVHKYSLIWQPFDKDRHYKKCSCGNCIYEDHTFAECICTVCSYNKEDPITPPGESSDGGFVVSFIIKIPYGHIEFTKEGQGNNYTCSLVDERNSKSQESYPITNWNWYVSDVEKSTEETLTVEVPEGVSYEISCSFQNGEGSGYTSVIITGK